MRREKVNLTIFWILGHPNVHENLSKNPIWSLEKTLSFLKKHRVRDILVIKTDANRNLADHMIIATGITTKHLTVIGEELYSHFIKDFKNHYTNDIENNNGQFYNNISWQEASKHIQLEGNRGKSDWVCVNILSSVIHLLSDYSRTNLCLEELHLLSHHDPYSQPMKDDREMQEEIDNKVFKLMSDTQQLNFQSTFDDLKDQYMMGSDQPLENFNESELKSSYATSLDSRGEYHSEMDLIDSDLGLAQFDLEDVDSIRNELLDHHLFKDLGSKEDFNQNMKLYDQYLEQSNVSHFDYSEDSRIDLEGKVLEGSTFDNADKKEKTHEKAAQEALNDL